MAKFPKIEYRLIELKPLGTTNGAARFEAVGALTVHGVSLTNTMPVTVERKDQTRLKVTGATPLKMTDFGIKPPVPVFPPIKTGDSVTISFDWLAAQKSETAK
jgi:polyisoprenoid-binding protein YceI